MMYCTISMYNACNFGLKWWGEVVVCIKYAYNFFPQT